jgi:phage tail-like protein
MSANAMPYPFTTFNFSVEITKDGSATSMCNAAFSDCDGLEMSMEVKTVREGGNNNQQIRFAGPVTYGQLTLKRGMTSSFDLWDWFTETVRNPALRADAEVVLYSEKQGPDRDVRARFKLTRCVPVKIKAPALNAKDGAVAIEELQLAYEEMTFTKPSPPKS